MKFWRRKNRKCKNNCNEKEHRELSNTLSLVLFINFYVILKWAMWKETKNIKINKRENLKRVCTMYVHVRGVCNSNWSANILVIQIGCWDFFSNNETSKIKFLNIRWCDSVASLKLKIKFYWVGNSLYYFLLFTQNVPNRCIRHLINIRISLYRCDMNVTWKLLTAQKKIHCQGTW